MCVCFLLSLFLYATFPFLFFGNLVFFYFPIDYYWILFILFYHPCIIHIPINLLSPWVMNECHKQKIWAWEMLKSCKVQTQKHKHSNLLFLHSYMENIINYAPHVLYSCKRQKRWVLVSTDVTSNSTEKQILKRGAQKDRFEAVSRYGSMQCWKNGVTYIQM